MKLIFNNGSGLKLVSFPTEIVLTHKDPVIFTTWVRSIREAIIDKAGGVPSAKGNEMRRRKDQLKTIRKHLQHRQSSGFVNYMSQDYNKKSALKQ